MLVDDHSVVREGLRALLEKEEGFEVVGEAADGKEAIEAFRLLRPDLVILDLQLPDKDGKGLIPIFLDEAPKTRILVLSTFSTETDVTLSLTLGAKGFLMKSAPATELVQAVRRVAQGGLYLSSDAAAQIPNGLRSKPLTDRELEIMRLVGQGCSNDEIAEALAISTHTLKTHFTHILAKLEVKDRTQALVAAVKRGMLRLS